MDHGKEHDMPTKNNQSAKGKVIDSVEKVPNSRTEATRWTYPKATEAVKGVYLVQEHSVRAVNIKRWEGIDIEDYYPRH